MRGEQRNEEGEGLLEKGEERRDERGGMTNSRSNEASLADLRPESDMPSEF